MARDLILGKTRRDWSCGAATDPATALRVLRGLSRAEEWLPHGHVKRIARDLQHAEETQALGEAVEREVKSTYDLIVLLTSADKLPAAERRSFSPTMRRWQELNSSRRGRYLPEDYVTLLNIRAACADTRRKISDYVKASKESHKPESPRETSPGTQRPSVAGMAVMTAVGLAGTWLLSRKEKR
jgi:hypothetical protein